MPIFICLEQSNVKSDCCMKEEFVQTQEEAEELSNADYRSTSTHSLIVATNRKKFMSILALNDNPHNRLSQDSNTYE